MSDDSQRGAPPFRRGAHAKHNRPVVHDGVGLRFVLDLAADEILTRSGPDVIDIDLGPVLWLKARHAREALKDAVQQAEALAAEQGRGLCVLKHDNTLNTQFEAQMLDPRFDGPGIERLRQTIFYGRSAARELPTLRRPGIPFDPAARVRLRYGNVELRVVENFLTRRDDLFAALDRVMGDGKDDEAMFADGDRTSHLATDDPDWNLRRLMTNAGFYASHDPQRARQDLDNWCRRYLAALQKAPLIGRPEVRLMTYGIQRALAQTGETLLSEGPGWEKLELYDHMAGREVLMVSPMADLVNAQAERGAFQNLFTDYQPPEFSVRAIPAPMSVWPHRPDDGWTASFEALCAGVAAAWTEKPFEVFVAACGCYGLPLSDHVARTFDVPVVYNGNMAHAFFGIRQAATERIMAGRRNDAAWVSSDLARYENVARIDGGRYV